MAVKDNLIFSAKMQYSEHTNNKESFSITFDFVPKQVVVFSNTLNTDQTFRMYDIENHSDKPYSDKTGWISSPNGITVDGNVATVSDINLCYDNKAYIWAFG